MDVRLLAEVHNGPQEVEEPLKTLERFEHVYEVLGGELLVVLGGYLHAHLQVLTDVGLHHCLQALQRVFHGQRAKVVNQPVRVQHVGVDHRSLDVVDVRVVLQGALEQPRLLAELGNVGLVVVGEHLVAHDSIGHLDRRKINQDGTELISYVNEVTHLITQSRIIKEGRQFHYHKLIRIVVYHKELDTAPFISIGSSQVKRCGLRC